MEKPFAEMNRVLKPGGKLVIIDMESAAEELRDIEDEIETMRDCSHVKNRSRLEFEAIYDKYGYELEREETTLIPVKLSAWMDLTNTPVQAKNEIIMKMESELQGKEKTGFSPYKKEEEVYFNQRWLLMIGIK